MSDRTKLRFRYEDSQGQDETETMWSIAREDGFEIDNIPFYVTGLALGDIVDVEPDIDGVLWYSRLVRSNGHSTIQILFDKEDDIGPVCGELERVGCSWEGSDIRRLVAVDVPPTVSYSIVRDFLDEKERAGVLEYQEACLGFDD